VCVCVCVCVCVKFMSFKFRSLCGSTYRHVCLLFPPFRYSSCW